jgi:RNA polymerase sigma factor (sigma-70 family)
VSKVAELFVITLGRASRRARRHLRDLSAADRDDVIGAAILWCWENRSLYNPAVPLDDWFVGAIRNARRDWARGEAREASELVEDIASADDTLARAETEEAARKLLEAMPAQYRLPLRMIAGGYTRAEIMAAGVSKDAIYEARARARQLRRLLPEDTEYRRVLRAGAREGSDNDTRSQAPIDREIEKLEFSPPQGKECPPCWRCKWFEGYLPGAHKPVRMPLQEPEVRFAVLDTEARKVQIAKRVRAGTINRGEA